MAQDLSCKDTNATMCTTENEVCSSMFLDSDKLPDYFTGTSVFAFFLIPAHHINYSYFRSHCAFLNLWMVLFVSQPKQYPVLLHAKTCGWSLWHRELRVETQEKRSKCSKML